MRGRAIGKSKSTRSWLPALVVLSGAWLSFTGTVLHHQQGYTPGVSPSVIDEPSMLAIPVERLHNSKSPHPTTAAKKPQGSAVRQFTAIPHSNETLAEGEYILRNASWAGGDGPRILLYVTTHVSHRHLWYLRLCWPEALKHSRLLRDADVAVYANPPEEERRRALEAIGNAFLPNSSPGSGLAVHLMGNTRSGQNTEKDAGAVTAMWYAMRNGLFGGYDWIVRVNPDVIIRDDSFLMDTIRNDPSASAVFIDCLKNMKDRTILSSPAAALGVQVHTDFFALRPRLLDSTRPFKWSLNAEMSFTIHLVEGELGNVSRSEGVRWLPGADHEGRSCRAGEGRAMDETPVTHVHLLEENYDRVGPGTNVHYSKGVDVGWMKECPIPFAGDARPS